MPSVFQEQAILLIILCIIGVAIWIRLGSIEQVLRGQQPAKPTTVKTGTWRDKPKVTDAQPPRWRESTLPPDVARAYYGEPPPPRADQG